MSDQTYTRRTTLLLRHAARFMRRLPRSAAAHFDMRAWLSHRGMEPLSKLHGVPATELRVTDLLVCGTAACAAGWLATCPLLNRLGYRFSTYGTPVFNEDDGPRYVRYEAVRRVLGLPERHVSPLFSLYDVERGGRSLRSPTEWADFAQEFLAAHGAPLTWRDRVREVLNLEPQL